ncbi:MAG: hypothetical protein EBZ48_04835 [Proteobacteria bacterium]|nr:hypothetical protein [Pseudomonadota bacterium]
MRSLLTEKKLCLKWIGASALWLLALLLSATFVWYTRQIRTDDSFIFLVYARNLAAGNGFVFNLGERVYGSTSALFPILIAGLSWPLRWICSEPLVVASWLLQGLSLVAVCICSARIFVRMGIRGAGVLFPFLFLGNELCLGGVGMESFLVLALLMWSVERYVSDKLMAASVFAGFLTLARPDGLLFCVALGGHYLLRYRRGGATVGAICIPVFWFPSPWHLGSEDSANSRQGAVGGGACVYQGALYGSRILC